MPNMVWMPSALSALSDMHESHVQLLLQRSSVALFRNVEVANPVRYYAEYAWHRLPTPRYEGRSLSTNELAVFDADHAFVRRRVNYLTAFVHGAEAVLESGQLRRKLISTRYTAGLPLLDPAAIADFRDAMLQYRDAVQAAGLTTE